MHDPSDFWFELGFDLFIVVMGIIYAYRAYIGKKIDSPPVMPSIVDPERPQMEKATKGWRIAWMCMGISMAIAGLLAAWHNWHHWH